MARYHKNEKIKSLPHFGAGINNNDDPTEIEDYQLASSKNFEINEKVLRTAAGHVDYGSETGNAIWGAFEGRKEDGHHILVRQLDTRLQYDNGSGVWTDCTGATGLTEERCTFAMLNNIILWSNGTDVVRSSEDGKAWIEQNALPKVRKIMHNGLNRMLYVWNPKVPSKIEWSNINDPLTVDASSYQFIGKNDGEQVLDCAITEKGGLYIFKTTNVYAIGDVTFDMIGIDPIGSIPYIPFTAVATNNSVIVTGFDGIYEIVGGTITHISKNLKRIDTEVNNTDTPVATYFKNKYRVSLPISSQTNDSEIIVDRKQPTGDGFNPYAIMKNERTIGAYVQEQTDAGNSMRYRCYVGGSTSGSFGWINADHDQGVQQGIYGNPQTSEIETKFFKEDVPFYIKRYLRYFINAVVKQQSTIHVCYRFDPVGAYICSDLLLETGEFDWNHSITKTSGPWSGGFGFNAPLEDDKFISLEKYGVPRGIQFKVSTTTTKDVIILSQSFKFLIKPNYH